MKATVGISLLSLAIAVLMGCTHKYGKAFDANAINRLVLGQTTPQGATSILGTPKARNTTSKAGNTFVRYSYAYAEVERKPFGGADFFEDRLEVEFLDDRLHGYFYQRVNENDDLPLKLREVEALHKGVATQQDAVNILGQPAGKALNPTNLAVFDDVFGYEVWLWFAVREVGDSLEIQKILLGFSHDGKLESVTTSVTTEDF